MQPLNIAIYEPLNLLGQEVRKRLRESAIPVLSMKFYGEGEAIGKIAEYDGEPIVVVQHDPDLLPFLDLVFLCGPAESIGETAVHESVRGPLFVDLSGKARAANCFASGVKEPASGSRLRWFSGPDAAAVLISTVLKPLLAEVRAKVLQATVFRPVSDFGQNGIEELYQQTTNLLNMKSVPTKALGRRVAFDLFPLAGKEEDSASQWERVERELRWLLPGPSWGFELSSFVAPVFFGLSVLLLVEGEIPAPERVREMLGGAPLIRLLPPGKMASPGSIEENDDVFVTLLPSREPERFLKIWIAADNLRRGCACNAIEILERYLPTVHPSDTGPH